MNPLGEVRILEGQPPSSPWIVVPPAPEGLIARSYGTIRGLRSRGDVVKWLNTEVCKTSIQRFESARRLHTPAHESTEYGAALGVRSDGAGTRIDQLPFAASHMRILSAPGVP